MHEPPLILLVDDEPSVLTLMSEILSSAGYRIAAANSGESCLIALETLTPDLILCDVVMPGIDGYAICRELKSQPEKTDIPLIFLTALKEPDEMLAGFAAGAVDFLTKPVMAAELLARVKTHTDLKRSRDALTISSQKLNALNAEKDLLLGIVAHDLRNPISTIYTAERVLRSKTPDLDPATEKLFVIIEQACRSADDLIAELLEIAELEQNPAMFNLEPVNSNDFLEGVMDSFSVKAQTKAIHLELELPDHEITLKIHPAKMVRALGNLIHNAIKFTPNGGTVSLTLTSSSDAHILKVQDNGIGIPEELKQHIFDKYTQARRKGLGGEQAHGLGMHITRQIIHKHGGQILLDSQVEKGTAFTIILPKSSV